MRLLALTLATALVVNSAPTPSNFPPNMAEELQAVVTRYQLAVSKQQDAMLGAEMEAEIDGRLVGLKEEGQMRVKRIISKAGAITFDFLGFKGDPRVQKELIRRYLEEESKSRAYGALSITTVDYDFNIRAVITRDADTPNARRIYVFGVEPHKKELGLCRGVISVDGSTGMPLREACQMVKSPNVFLTDISFVRDYELTDGVSVVKHIESGAKVRFAGRAEITVDFSNFRHAEAPVPAGL